MKANLPILLPRQGRDTHHLHSLVVCETSPLALSGCKLQQKLCTIKNKILVNSHLRHTPSSYFGIVWFFIVSQNSSFGRHMVSV